MIRLILVVSIISFISGCNGESVEGGKGLRSYHDDANGVICYRVDSRALSCVKVK